MVDGLPARIDRAALERIIQRAAELQTADREIGEGLTTEQVMELGRDHPCPAWVPRRTGVPAKRPLF